MLSLNEIEMTLLKAARGVGLANGLAEEVSRAGRILTEQGFDGVRAVVTALNSYARSRSSPTLKVALHGPSLIDHLTQRHKGSSSGSLMVDCPLLLVGIAATLGADYDLKLKVTSDNSAQALTDAGVIYLQGGFGFTESFVEITRLETSDMPSLQPRQISRPDELPDGWNVAVKLAKRANVPSNDHSRARGAGAGLVDRD